MAHTNHMGYRGPAASKHHAAKHDSQMGAINRMHASRNNEHSLHVSDGGKGGRTASAPSREAKSDTRTGGSAKTHDQGNKGGGGGGAFGGTKSSMPAFKKAMGGSLDS
jgi:hypothetical protein